MIENNNTFNYFINDSLDLVVEITNNLDTELQDQFQTLIPDHEKNTVISILKYQTEISKVKKQQ